MTPEQRVKARKAGQPVFNPMLQDPDVVSVQMRPDGKIIGAMSQVGLTFLRQLGNLNGGWEAADPAEQAAHLMMTAAMVDAARRIRSQRQESKA